MSAFIHIILSVVNPGARAPYQNFRAVIDRRTYFTRYYYAMIIFIVASTANF